MARNKKSSRALLSSNAIALLASFAIVVGILLISYNFIAKRRMAVYDYVNEQLSASVNVRSITTSEEEQEKEPVVGPTDLQHYIGYLEIPKIHFNRGFYHIDSKENTVESNIEVIGGSSMPDVSRGNLIIAGHSGTGWKAFFNDLYQLSVGDTAAVTYQNKKYTYKIVNIERQAKTGKITIKRNKNKTTLTLITCTNNDDTTQTIYVAELVSVE